MATVVESATAAPDQRVVLGRVSWDTYLRLVADQGDRSVPRLTYDRGSLEALAPSTEHEKGNRALALVVEVVGAALGYDPLDVGGMTFQRCDIRRGFEADTAFYVQHARQVEGKKQIDANVDPPPDLVIEIEVRRSSLAKLPVYAAFGVPEVWRYDGVRVTIYRLDAGGYAERATSEVLPGLTDERLTRFVVGRQRTKRSDWLVAVQAWARTFAAGKDEEP